MEATRHVLAALVIGVVATGCGQNEKSKVKSTSLYGQQCATQAKEHSFLVEWESVPKEYEKYVLSPGSRITRFNDIEKDLLEKAVLAKHEAQVISAEHDFVLKHEADPLQVSGTTCSNPFLPSAWGPGDVKASQAWATLGNKGDGVVVAVIDSGVEINHTLLASQIWVNSGEIPGNGIDDDGNGYVDDYKGLSILTDDLLGTVYSPNVKDESNHGTHVAGIIAGQSGSLGFTGVAPNSKIMPLKFLDAEGEGTVGDAITAMEYAQKNGAKVINASWGGPLCSDLLRQQIQKVIQHGSVFVSAAGNRGKDLNIPAYLEWPAAFQIPGKLTVGSMNQSQLLSGFSNFGVLVDLAAPGESILSTVPPDLGMPNNTLCAKNGTSMATPFVSGIAALLMSARPNLNPVDLVNIINSSVTTGQFGVRTGGKINALKAAQTLLSTSP